MNEKLNKELIVFEDALFALAEINVFACPYELAIIDFCQEYIANTDMYISLSKLTDIAMSVFLQCKNKAIFLDCEMFHYALQKYCEQNTLSSLINDNSIDIAKEVIKLCQ